MTRLVFIFLLIGPLLSCSERAQSQEEVLSSPPDTSSQSVNEQISVRRQTAITRAVQTASPAVVSVNVIKTRRRQAPNPFLEQFFGQRMPRQLVQNVGSGFVISEDGYIVTNDHVAGNAQKITVSFASGNTLDARLIGTDPATDLALLKVDPPEPLDYLSFSDRKPIAGEWVIALGNPFGLFKATQPSVTVGVVSAVGRDLEPQEGRIYRDMIQTDASINRGNSGGPLLNALGKVIGVNTAIFSQSGGSIGIGFAVPAAKARRIIDELRKNGFIDRSYYTGLYTQNVNDRIARALDLEEAEGVIVRDLDPGSPADEAGLHLYDIIVSIDDEEVENRGDLVELIYEYRPGDRVQVEVLRKGEHHQIEMRIGRRSG